MNRTDVRNGGSLAARARARVTAWLSRRVRVDTSTAAQLRSRRDVPPARAPPLDADPDALDDAVDAAPDARRRRPPTPSPRLDLAGAADRRHHPPPVGGRRRASLLAAWIVDRLRPPGRRRLGRGHPGRAASPPTTRRCAARSPRSSASSTLIARQRYVEQQARAYGLGARAARSPSRSRRDAAAARGRRAGLGGGPARRRGRPRQTPLESLADAALRPGRLSAVRRALGRALVRAHAARYPVLPSAFAAVGGGDGRLR